jgi:hypothetical protein
MRKSVDVTFLIVIIFFLVPISGYAASTNSCTNCHTNDAIMKALFKAPVLPPSEGEG